MPRAWCKSHQPIISICMLCCSLDTSTAYCDRGLAVRTSQQERPSGRERERMAGRVPRIQTHCGQLTHVGSFEWHPRPSIIFFFPPLLHGTTSFGTWGSHQHLRHGRWSSAAAQSEGLFLDSACSTLPFHAGILKDRWERLHMHCCIKFRFHNQGTTWASGVWVVKCLSC